MCICPECSAQMSISSEARVGEILACPDCLADLEVVSTNPVELALAPGVEEDWGE